MSQVENGKHQGAEHDGFPNEHHGYNGVPIQRAVTREYSLFSSHFLSNASLALESFKRAQARRHLAARGLPCVYSGLLEREISVLEANK